VTITITATLLPEAVGQTVANQASIRYDADGNGTNEATATSDDPGLPGSADATAFTVAGILEIPTLGPTGLALLQVALAGAALVLLRRRKEGQGGPIR
jgi:hypothetical protein